jgi:hypothetical protein
MVMKKRGLAKVKDLFWYSDSEPNEILISFCHLIALPASIIVEHHNPSWLLVAGAIAAGAFQMWAVVWNGTLHMRLLAVQIATLIAIMTIVNLCMTGLMEGSRTGWIVIGLFACWNTIRVFKEKIEKGV